MTLDLSRDDGMRGMLVRGTHTPGLAQSGGKYFPVAARSSRVVMAQTCYGAPCRMRALILVLLVLCLCTIIPLLWLQEFCTTPSNDGTERISGSWRGNEHLQAPLGSDSRAPDLDERRPLQLDEIASKLLDRNFGIVMMVYSTSSADPYFFQALVVMLILRDTYDWVPVEVFVHETSVELRRRQLEAAGLRDITITPMPKNANVSSHCHKPLIMLESRFQLVLYLDTDVAPCPNSIERLSSAIEAARGPISLKGIRKNFATTKGYKGSDRFGFESDPDVPFETWAEINSGVLLVDKGEHQGTEVLQRWAENCQLWANTWGPRYGWNAKDQGALRVASYLTDVHLDITLPGVELQHRDEVKCNGPWLFRHNNAFKYFKPNKKYTQLVPDQELFFKGLAAMSAAGADMLSLLPDLKS